MFIKKSVGLDISDHTIEVAELKKSGNNIRLSNLGRVQLDKGVVVNGRIRNKTKLSETLKNVLKSTQPNAVKSVDFVFGLSESCVFTHIFKIKNTKEEMFEQEILKEIKNTIPIEAKRLLYDYRIFQPYNYNVFNTSNAEKKKGDEDIFVRLVAVEKNIIFEWNDFFKENGLNIEIFDIESLATFRGMFDDFPENPVCIVDIGANKTKISIFTLFGLEYSFLLSIAGNDFTDIVSKYFKIDFEKAEKIKQLKLNIDYFEEKNNQAVKKIVFIGGSSKMNGLFDYLNLLDLQHEFQLGSHQYENVNLEYIEAIGLNFRNLEKRWKKTDPCFIINSKSNIKLFEKVKLFFKQ